jgi:hypothetical protein
MKLNSTFQKLAHSFLIEFDDLSKEIVHRLSSGEAREHALIALLRKYLPARAGVDRGFVIDATGRESSQLDVVIYDRTVGTVFEINGVKFFPCETVVAVGEVKSDIESTAKLADALAKLASAKALDRSNGGKNKIVSGPGVSLQGLVFDPTRIHRDQIFGFIFTSSSLSKECLLKQLQVHNAATPRHQWMNLFCDVRKFLLSYETSTGLHPSAMDATYLYCTDDCEVPRLLLKFFCILATFVDEAHVARPDFFAYGDITSTKASYHDLLPRTAGPDVGADSR